ncbi:MAG: hypothetical protein EZS28_014718 [Streblomastix strix]|uniref:Uncharacterized protein n=1 Tax=Streblomastix strix TaxID=222440 RepID=A0A5J4W5D6_9EUKA|nr:MAG: hypothetical protein EZS28_014718 [Streblomastix strix]
MNNTAGGAGKQKDDEIYWGLNDIYNLLSEFRYGRNFPFTSFQPLPALAKPCIEQIEEEGGNEEVESLLINNANEWNINNQAKCAIRDIFNYFIHSSNPRPFWYR